MASSFWVRAGSEAERRTIESLGREETLAEKSAKVSSEFGVRSSELFFCPSLKGVEIFLLTSLNSELRTPNSELYIDGTVAFVVEPSSVIGVVIPEERRKFSIEGEVQGWRPAAAMKGRMVGVLPFIGRVPGVRKSNLPLQKSSE